MKQLFRMIVVILVLPAASMLAQSSIANSKHNLSSGSGNTIRAQTETALCIFCHTPHSASAITTAPLWNRAQPSSTYQLYTSNYLSGLTVPYPAPSQPNAQSKLCLSCHDGTIAIGAVYNPGITSSPIPMAGAVTTMPTGSSSYVGTDLKNDHPVGFTYNRSSDPELVQRAWPWNTAVALDPDASTGRIECHTCHDPHDNQYSHFLRMSNTNAALCSHCHNKLDWSGNSGVHKVSTQTLTPPGASAPTTLAEYACRSCHASHSSSTGPYLLRATEELTCLNANCHGANAISSTKNIAAQYAHTYRHPTTDGATAGYHWHRLESIEGASRLQTNRHAECQDCHNPHVLQDGTHDGTTRDIYAVSGGSGVLKGTWGINPSWGTAPTNMTNNDNAWSTVTYGSPVNPATKEYQICLKCHSSYLTGSHRNIAEEINPAYPSYHGIVAGGTSNTYCNSTTMNAPWATNKIVWCSDCHGSSDAGSPPKGPHGSNEQHMLVATAVSNSTVGTPLCNVCHKETTYWSSNATGSRFTQHPSSKSAHKLPKGCYTCHMYDFNSNASYGGGSYGGNSLKIFVHGMNKRYYWGEMEVGSGKNKTIATSPTGHMADAFVAGYMADIDFTLKKCWTEDSGNTEYSTNCGHTHAGSGY
jgi:predicted CXXCH cytochrome family protein